MDYGKGGYAIADCTFLTESNLSDLLNGTPVEITPDQFEQLFDAIGSGKPVTYIAITNKVGTVLYIPCQQMRKYIVVTHEASVGEIMMHTEVSNNPVIVHASCTVMHTFATDVCELKFDNIIVTS